MKIRLHIASTIAASLFAAALFACLPSGNAAVVAFYNFDEGGGSTAGDSSVNGFNGSILGSSAPTWVSGGGASGDISDTSLDFIEGVTNSGYVNIPGNPVALQLTGSRTISFWIKADPVIGARQSILEKAYNHEGTYHIYQNGSFLLYNGDEPNPNNINNTALFSTRGTGAVVTSNVWMHVLDTRDSVNQTQQYYINGVGQGNVTWTPALRNPNTVSNTDWKIGTGYEGTFGGELDDFGFFDRELTSGEIASTYQLDAQSDNALRLMGMNVPELDELWDIYNGGLGNAGYVDGKLWTHVDGISLDGHVLGQAWSVSTLSSTNTYLLLNTLNNSGLQLTVLAAPEPSTFALLGGACLLAARRRRKACM